MQLMGCKETKLEDHKLGPVSKQNHDLLNLTIYLSPPSVSAPCSTMMKTFKVDSNFSIHPTAHHSLSLKKTALCE